MISYPTTVIYIIAVFLALKLLFEYKNALTEVLARIISQYLIAVALFLVGGNIISMAFRPIIYEDQTIGDLSYLRSIVGIIGGISILVTFIIVYRSVSKFRKILA